MISKEVINMKFDTSSLIHTTWNCKYHIVFASKYRRKVIYGKQMRQVYEDRIKHHKDNIKKKLELLKSLKNNWSLLSKYYT